MDSNKLVKMANDIAAFFEAEPDPAACSAGIGGHIGRFWDPRMRRALFRHLDEHGGRACATRWSGRCPPTARPC